MKKRKTRGCYKNIYWQQGYYSSTINSGLKVNHARAGKNIIGTANPGKSSGFFTDKGRETDIGIITPANEKIEIMRLKANTLFFFEILMKK